MTTARNRRPVRDATGVLDRARVVLKRHGVLRASVFGSFARSDDDPNDIDLLVELPDTRSLLDLVALKLDLEDALGCPADVLTYDGLHSRIRERALAEQISLL